MSKQSTLSICAVINVTLPDEKQNYVHRIGRVGRAERCNFTALVKVTVIIIIIIIIISAFQFSFSAIMQWHFVAHSSRKTMMLATNFRHWF